MHIGLANFIKKRAAPINMDLAEGLVKVRLKDAAEYIDTVNRSAARSWTFPITYVDYRVCTAVEMYYASLKTRRQKRKTPKVPGMRSAGDKTYDMSRTDFFLIEMRFRHKDRDIKLPVWLAYAGDAGSIYISGTKWFISPVLADKVISLGIDQIFVRLLRDRPTFSRMAGWYRCNGEGMRADLTHSKIYHTSKDKDKQSTNSAVTTLPHYLFCKYGFTKTMEKYTGITPIVGYNLADQYSADEYFIYSSNDIPPVSSRGRKKIVGWVKPEIQVAIKKTDYNPSAAPYIAGLFYVADYFPRQITPDVVDSPDGWIAPMGYILFSENNNRGNIEKAIRKHLASLDGYADSIVIDNMAAVGIEIENFYDFFAIITDRFSFWIANNQDKINSLYNKEMSVLPFVLFDVVRGIFNNYFALEANAHKDLRTEEVEDIMKKHIRPGMCYQLGRSHGEVQSISYAGDNKAFKATATLTSQTATSKMVKKGNDRGTANDPAFKMHPSIAEVAASTAMSKGDPIGTSKLNHYLLLDPTKTKILRNPLFREIQDKIARNELTTRPIE